MKVYVVVSVYAGCIDEVQAFADEAAADAFLAKQKQELDIEPGNEAESENDAKVFELEVEPVPTM